MSRRAPLSWGFLGLFIGLFVAAFLLFAAPAGATTEIAPPLSTARALSLGGVWRIARSYQPGARQLPQGEGGLVVPSNWHTQGLEHEGVLWLVRKVDVTSHAPAWRLELGGCDYRCEVYWDGALAGSHTGYFAPFSVPVAATPGEHTLAIKVESPRETSRAWSLHKTLIKGVLSHHDTRPGGAWSPDGQDANTGGLWGAVHLVPATTAWLDRPRATTLRLEAGRAELALTAQVTPVASAAAQVRWSVLSPAGAEVASGSWSGTGPLRASVVLPNPELWWPRELGASPLYTLRLRAGTDEATTRFGIRTVERDPNSRYLFNGQPLFLRGTNYIGSLYLATLDRAAVQRDLELMLRANLNAVRVHAHVTSPAFYEVADELGLLVWQDFPLQWGYEDTPAFTAEATRQLGEMLAHLGGHPSVIHWTAQNEAPWSSEWMTYKYPLYDPDQNRALSAALSAVLATDSTRPSQANSGTAEHAWMGWYSGSYRDFARPQAHAILTELGAQALPRLSTLRTILRPEQLWPLERNLPVWEYHNFQKHELVNIAKVPLGDTLASLITNTQAYQARLLQFSIEALRRQAWQPMTGVFQFMFVEHWPSMNWGVVDYLRQPKPGYFALQRAFQPILPIAYAHQKGSLRLHVVSDRPKAESVIVTASRERNGKVTYQRSLRQTLTPGAVTLVEGALARPGPGEGLRLLVTTPDNRVLAENFYAPGYFAD